MSVSPRNMMQRYTAKTNRARIAVSYTYILSHLPFEHSGSHRSCLPQSQTAHQYSLKHGHATDVKTRVSNDALKV